MAQSKVPAKSTPAKPTPVKATQKAGLARTTLSGVYTAAEARAGRDMYAGLCANCHAAISHTGPGFRKKWAGKPLSDLFTYIRTMMPKNEPASLAYEDYGVLLAYMLQLNKMPAGREPLSTDSLVLAKIRIDTARTIKVAKPSG